MNDRTTCPASHSTPSHRFLFLRATATTVIYSLSLHDALPIFALLLEAIAGHDPRDSTSAPRPVPSYSANVRQPRSEEHTSELQSRLHLVCRLLLDKKK